ncbi:MAG: hypothetical protein H0T46_16670 [Deltaproteobacteria bacterium]|nr:hypothetical protein [Deltaproteobacteria bacterium]
MTTVTAPAEPASGGYPVELVARPLILPDGAVEGGANLVWQRVSPGNESFSFVTAVPHVRFAAPGVELMGQASIGLYQTEQGSPGMTVEIERLQSIGAGLRHGISPDAAIGAVFEIRLPATDFKSYNGRAVAAMKRHLGARSAFELSGFAGASRTTTAIPGLGSYEQDQLLGGCELRLQAQLSPIVAAEARTSVTLRKLLDQPPEADTTFVAQDHGVRLVAAVNRDVDLTAGFDVVESQFRVVLFTVGVVARRLP